MSGIDAALEAERSALMALAFRMLGTVADAEDAVQETYVRWYRLEPSERDAIRNPGAWLTRVAGRVCLDMLGSARARRERYVGEWLPEPVPRASEIATAGAGIDPLDRVTLDDSVSTALLVVLESLTPAERVVFVLHDVFGMPFAEVAETVGRTPAACRQLASTARRHVRERRAGAATRDRHDELVAAFADACASGDLDRLMSVLDDEVVLRSDGGGLVSAARRPVVGPDHVGRFLLGLLRKAAPAPVGVDLVEAGGGKSLRVMIGGQLAGVISLGVAGDRVSDVWVMVNPQKLGLWQRR